MLIIGHRGAAGIAPENTLASLAAGIAAGVDMLEFDIRVTKDNIPILAHNARQHGLTIRRHTISELREAGTITLLTDVLDSFFSKTILNIELKHEDSAVIVYNILQHYIVKKSDWDSVIFSSFRVKALRLLREQSDTVNLALLQHANPFHFTLYHRELNFTAIGFHRLFANSLAIATAKELGIFTYAYTVNRAATATRLSRRGIDGIVTDYPNILIEN